jgi:TolB protein
MPHCAVAIVSAAALAVALAACGSKHDGGTASAKAAVATSTASAPATRPAGLPAGHLLYRRFLSDDKSHGAIYAVAPGETNGRAITHPPAGVADDLASPSPDGSRLALTRCNDRGCALFVARIDGSGVKRLSPRCCVDENSAAYSPDGRTLAFGRAWGRVKDGQIRFSEVFRMAANGHKRERLTHFSGAGYRGDTGNPSFSPDGKRIVFTVTRALTTPRAGDHAVFIMNADGSHQRRLTPWTLEAGDYPRFSPDGSRILFRANFDDGPGGDLYTMRPDGSQIEQLTRGIPGMLSAAWSPDGKYVAYAHEGGDGDQPDIWIMRADGTGAAQLTDAPEWDSLPAWGV